MSSLVPHERQGSAQGVYQGLFGGAVLLAGVWAGLAWHSTGQLPLLLSGSVAAVLAGALLVGALHGSTSNSRPRPQPSTLHQDKDGAAL